MRTFWTVASFAAALVSVAALAETDLSPETVGKLQYEQRNAVEKVHKEHGDKKDSELTSEERKQMAVDEREASQKVLEDAGVSEKDYSRYTSRMSPDQLQSALQSQKNAEKEAIRKQVKAETADAGQPDVVPYDSSMGAPAGSRGGSKSGSKHGGSRRR